MHRWNFLADITDDGAETLRIIRAGAWRLEQEPNCGNHIPSDIDTFTYDDLTNAARVLRDDVALH